MRAPPPASTLIRFGRFLYFFSDVPPPRRRRWSSALQPIGMEETRHDAHGQALWTTLKLCGLYAVYASVAVGIVMMLLRGPQSMLVAVAAGTFIMTWIAYGGIWLARAVPREDPLPLGLGDRFGYIDWAFLAVIIVSLAYVVLAA